jgi:hypothetical protein
MQDVIIFPPTQKKRDIVVLQNCVKQRVSSPNADDCINIGKS